MWQSETDLDDDIDEMPFLTKQSICGTDDKTTDTNVTEQVK